MGRGHPKQIISDQEGKPKMSQKTKFAGAAHKCKGTGKGFRACMKRELRKGK